MDTFSYIVYINTPNRAHTCHNHFASWSKRRHARTSRTHDTHVRQMRDKFACDIPITRREFQNASINCKVGLSRRPTYWLYVAITGLDLGLTGLDVGITEMNVGLTGQDVSLAALDVFLYLALR